MAEEKKNKAIRVLEMYLRLSQGRTIYREEECNQYGIDERTFKRDIKSIKDALEGWGSDSGIIQEIVSPDKDCKGYRLSDNTNNLLEPKELLAVCKVLLESRSMVKGELFPIIDKLIESCGGAESRKLVKDYIRNEMYHYVELQHHKKLLDRLWELERAVKEQRYTEIVYRKLKNKEKVIRKVKPVGIMFSEFYFYLTAYIEDIDKEKAFRNPDDIFPTIYRVDRLEEIRVLDEHFRVPYRERFEEGEFRKRVQFMYGGRLRRIRFRYTGNSPESILDKLPTAQIIKEEDAGIIFQAEVFGDGVDKWMRSQGDYITEVGSMLL